MQTTDLKTQLVKSNTGAECYAVQVTKDNLEQVALWCDGEVVEVNAQSPRFNDLRPVRSIRTKFAVGQATRAFIGDYIVRYKGSDHWYYIYSEWSFRAMFEVV